MTLAPPAVLRTGPGLLLAAGVAGAALALAKLPLLQASGLGVMSLAILLGMALGTLARPPAACEAGLALARTRLLRQGIVLYGARLSLQDVAEVGAAGVLIALAVLLGTLALALWLGRRLGLDRSSALLIGAGSAICGAAAVMATQTQARAREADVAMAVATVVLFGTLAMLLYPVLHTVLPLSPHDFGVYAGATIHEVAQVVVVGEQLGEAAARAALIEKMLRVMMLAPFLLLLPWTGLLGAPGPAGTRPALPWFALAFVAVIALNSLGAVPPAWQTGLRLADSVLLTTAMAAVGLHTDLWAFRRGGVRPLLLAGALFAFLVGGGYAIQRAVMAALGAVID